ncbi:hypothetical protein H8958_016036 [Nasalis larvatus]
MRLLTWLIFLAHWGGARAEPGKFWHITDLHLDPDHKVPKYPLQVCPSAGFQSVPNAGPWGDYLCDSPWALINSSIYAMKEIAPEPDFILWTGDDMSHVPEEKLGEAAVLEIVKCLTKLIREVFLDTKVYAALGNHDFHPKNQFPAGINKIDNQIAELWKPWLSNESIALFKKGFFEKTQNKAWFQEGFNEKYLKVVWKHGRVTAGQFFRHHHTDSSRMLYDDAGAPISAMFITPGVTPWKTTLPGVINGPNNPVIWVFEYD